MMLYYFVEFAGSFANIALLLLFIGRLFSKKEPVSRWFYACLLYTSLCCGIKHTKSKKLPPHAPQISGFDLLSLFSSGACLPFPGGCRAAARPSGWERNQNAPQEGACIPAMRPIKSTQEGTFVWFWARGARKFKFSHFFGAAASGQERQALTYLPAHKGATQPELRRVWRSAKETCL